MHESLEDVAWSLLSPQFKKHKKLCQKISFPKGTLIVQNGEFKSSAVNMYAAVPLSFIMSGTVAILQNGRAIKHYHDNECFGLFETACFLDKGISARIGRWSVQAVTDVELLVSSEAFLDTISVKAKTALLLAARTNPIAKPLSRLPLLDWFATKYPIEPQKDTVIIYHSHILSSSEDLLKYLAYIAGPDNTFVLEKPYSTLHESFSKLAEGGIRTYPLKIDSSMSYEYSIKRNVDHFWREVIEHVRGNAVKKIIVVSDGADVLLSPLLKELSDIEIVGVEQTQRGLDRLRKIDTFFPIVSIAASKAKKQYESPFIAGAALAKMQELWLLNPHFSYGVIGVGSIGREIIQGLNRLGIPPLIYDPLPTLLPTVSLAESLENLVIKSDIIIGTTGTDCLRGMFIERIKGKKTFISTSSSNIEFNYLFNLAKTYANKFEDVALQISDQFSAIILNGGYPINFDRIKEWESPENIQLTRTLMYAGVYDAFSNKLSGANVQSLRKDLDTEVLNQWLVMR